MSGDQARALLASIGFDPAADTLASIGERHDRDKVRAALNALRAEAKAAAREAAKPRKIEPVKQPRRPEDVPSRGERPGFQPPVADEAVASSPPTRRGRK